MAQQNGWRPAPKDPDALKKAVQMLEERYGDRAVDYVDAAIVRKELTYDDYIETRTLLSLQTTLTDHHDEFIFKVYHQQTELWFRLVLHEMERGIGALVGTAPSIEIALDAVTRINRYFSVITTSFSVLLEGLSSDEFLIYRKAFGTSSGFQSSQFRAIEILSGLERNNAPRTNTSESRPEREQQQTAAKADEEATFYWERAARHLTTNEPTLTLIKFKEQHLAYLNKLYQDRKPFSLRIAFDTVLRGVELGDTMEQRYDRLFAIDSNHPMRELALALLELDSAIITWKQMHLRVAAKHLAKAPRGTGETNWADYLAKSIAEQRCFPELAAAHATAAEPVTATSATPRTLQQT